MPQNLSEIQKNWDNLGKQDPLYAIKVGIMKEDRTWESKEGGKWTLHDFFQTGIDEVEAVMKEASLLNLKFPRTRALDFGCGIGRVTQALCTYFDRVDGVDIAPSMIELANIYNHYGQRVHYFLNNKNTLEIFKDNSYDFIYSVEVLQHMHPKYQEEYLRELLRVLSPGGLLVFELPSEYVNFRQKINFNFLFQDVKFIHSFFWKKILKQPSFAQMQYYCNPRSHIESILAQYGAKNVHAIRNWRTIISYNYYVMKY